MIPIGERVLMQVWWVDATNVAGGWHDTDALDDFAGNGAWECSNTGWLVHEDDLCYVLAGRMTDDGSNVGLVERIPKSAVTRKAVLPMNGGAQDGVFGEFRRVPSPVPGFVPGDKVWPKTGSSMILQPAPQTVIATYSHPEYGPWLWLDDGHTGFHSSAAVNWTTEEPDEAEKASRARRARERAVKNERLVAGNPRLGYPFGGFPGTGPQGAEPESGPVIFVPARDGLTPNEIRAVQDRLNDVAGDLAIGKFVILPPGAMLIDMPQHSSSEGKRADAHDAGRCPDCHMPVTMHCDPACSRPCRRCAEAEAKRPPVLELPLHMKHPASSRRVRAQQSWEEAFPGLQVRGLAVGAGKGGALAYDLEFRLTPDGAAAAAAEAEDRVTVSLPAYMAEPGHRHVATIGREWGDVVDGQPLQARLGVFTEDARATVDFRIAPEDQQHD